LDEWVILPNHFHCIITFGDYDFDNGVSDVGGSGGVDKIHEFYLHEFYLCKSNKCICKEIPDGYNSDCK